MMNRARRSGARLWTVGLAAVGLGAVLLVRAAVADDKAAPRKTVSLIVDYNDGVEKHFTALPWKKGMTVFDVLQLARKHSHGITFEYKDYGGRLGYMITRIDDLENQGTGGEAKDWIYKVDDELAKKACNKYELQAGDVVRWTFEHLDM